MIIAPAKLRRCVEQLASWGRSGACRWTCANMAADPR